MLQKKAHESYWNTSEEEKNTKASISWNKKKKKIPNMFVNNRNLSEEEKAGFFLVITKKNNSKAIVLKYNKFFLSMKK